MDYRNICVEVCEIARAAGRFIAAERSRFSVDRVEEKGVNNLVSYVDKQAERQIVSALRTLLPEAGFITEEGSVAPDKSAEYQWVIDPLDGTTNFIHGLPPYAVSIALMHRDRVVVGVVHEVTLNETFYAWQGSAAYLNGAPIAVSSVPVVARGLIVTGLAYDTQGVMETFMRSFEYFNRHSHGARRLGSAATDLVYVAAGRCDAFYQVNLSPWDVAAGGFIVERAGGKIAEFDRGTDWVFGRSVIATNAHLWDEIQAQVAPGR